MKIDEEAFRQGYMSVKEAFSANELVGFNLPQFLENIVGNTVQKSKNWAVDKAVDYGMKDEGIKKQVMANPQVQAMAQKTMMDGFGDKVKGFFSNPMALGGTALVAGGLMLPSLLGNKKTKKPLQQPNMGAQQGMSPLQQQARDTRFAFDKPDLTA